MNTLFCLAFLRSLLRARGLEGLDGEGGSGVEEDLVGKHRGAYDKSRQIQARHDIHYKTHR